MMYAEVLPVRLEVTLVLSKHRNVVLNPSNPEPAVPGTDRRPHPILALTLYSFLQPLMCI